MIFWYSIFYLFSTYSALISVTGGRDGRLCYCVILQCCDLWPVTCPLESKQSARLRNPLSLERGFYERGTPPLGVALLLHNHVIFNNNTKLYWKVPAALIFTYEISCLLDLGSIITDLWPPIFLRFFFRNFHFFYRLRTYLFRKYCAVTRFQVLP
jgi:hypothetical protein